MGNRNIWQGENVRLRGIEPRDYETMFQWRSDSDAYGKVDYLSLPRSFESFKKAMDEAVSKGPDGDNYAFAIENREGELVGEAGTFGCNRRMGTFKYGVFIAREHWGKGYGKEAVRLLLRFYFMELGYQKVTIHIVSFNERSIKFHERLGFQMEGRLRRMSYVNGHYYDEIYLGMTREEFLEKLG